MSKGEDILLFDAVISILLLAFGAGTNTTGINVQLQPPLLAPTPKNQIQNCQNTDAGCIAQNLTLATAYIGWAIVNLPVLIIFFTIMFFTFGAQVIAVSFSPQNSVQGVPFLGFFFIALQVYVLWEVLRTIRGNSTAGV